jgi:CheY-like chemotaxis protein
MFLRSIGDCSRSFAIRWRHLLAKTLLAVDDSVTMRRVLEITFSGEDFQVLLAGNRAAALEEAAKNPDVVLIDTVLDTEDGYALAKELRGKLPRAAVILLASRHNPYDAGRGAEAGADDTADKPFDTQAIRDKVKKVLAAKESGEAPAVAAAPAAPPAIAKPPVPPARPAASTMFGVAPPAVAAKPPVPVAAPAAPVAAPAAPKPAPPAPFASPAAPAAPKPAPVSAPVAAAPSAPRAATATLANKLDGLGLTKDQVDAVLALSREVVEKAVWEVVPALAETLIKEEIARLTKP